MEAIKKCVTGSLSDRFASLAHVAQIRVFFGWECKMTRVLCSLMFAALSCVSCVSQKESVATSPASSERRLYDRFYDALAAGDVAAVNALLAPGCEFKEYSTLSGWYSFYRDSVNTIGPFPLSDYADKISLNLVRPNGADPTDFTRFHVFGRHYDLFLVFDDGKVRIEGSGKAGSGTSQPDAPADSDKPRR